MSTRFAHRLFRTGRLEEPCIETLVRAALNEINYLIPFGLYWREVYRVLSAEFVPQGVFGPLPVPMTWLVQLLAPYGMQWEQDFWQTSVSGNSSAMSITHLNESTT